MNWLVSQLFDDLSPVNHCQKRPTGESYAEVKHLVNRKKKERKKRIKSNHNSLYMYADILVTNDQAGCIFIIKQGSTKKK